MIKQFLFTVWLWADGLFYIEWFLDMIDPPLVAISGQAGSERVWWLSDRSERSEP